MSVGSGSVVMSSRADIGICMRGEEEVPRRSPGSRSVGPEIGIVWYLLATKLRFKRKRRRGGACRPDSGR